MECEFKKGDIIVEIGSQDLYLVSEDNVNYGYYGLHGVDKEGNDLETFFGVNMDKVHKSFVKVGRCSKGQLKKHTPAVPIPIVMVDDRILDAC